MEKYTLSPNVPMTRRRFIYTSALATGATIVTGPILAGSPRKLSANDKLNIGCVGCGGKGSSDIQWCSSENIVALCDVSENAKHEIATAIRTKWRRKGSRPIEFL